MTIRIKLNLVLSALLGATLAAGLATFYVVGVYTDKSSRVAWLEERSRKVEEIRASILRWTQRALVSAVHDRDPSVEALKGSIRDRLAIMTRTAATPRERAALSRVGEAFGRFERRVRAESGADAARPEFTEIEVVERRIDVLRQGYETKAYDALSESAMAGFRARVVAAAACVLIVVPAGWLLILTRRSLIEPIDRLVEATGEIGRGRFDHQVRLSNRDELGRLAEQVNEMAARLSDHQEKLLLARELAAIGEICAGVAHGMRNPLAGIRTSAQVLSRRLSDRPDDQERLAELIDEVDRLEARIARLLDFARPSVLDRRAVTVGALVDAAARDVNGALRRSGTQVVTSEASRVIRIDVDPDQFSQALAELFSNSAHHMPSGGRITVHAASSVGNGNGVCTRISVADTGSGIPPAGREHAFELFFTTRAGGTGVGLAAVRRIVEAHGGRVTLTSEPGEGTAVHITLAASNGERLPMSADR